MQYTLAILPNDDTEWDFIIYHLHNIGIRDGVLLDKHANVIYITQSPVVLARILSVITGAIYEE